MDTILLLPYVVHKHGFQRLQILSGKQVTSLKYAFHILDFNTMKNLSSGGSIGSALDLFPQWTKCPYHSWINSEKIAKYTVSIIARNPWIRFLYPHFYAVYPHCYIE